MKPYAIDKIVDPITDKVKLEHKPEEVENLLQRKQRAQVRQLLERVVTSPKGTGQLIKLMDIQLVVNRYSANSGWKRHYMTGRQNYIFSFLGMAPMDDPQLVVCSC